MELADHDVAVAILINLEGRQYRSTVAGDRKQRYITLLKIKVPGFVQMYVSSTGGSFRVLRNMITPPSAATG